jgi:hypothetical protein
VQMNTPSNETNLWASAAVAALLANLKLRAEIALPWLVEAEELIWTPL